MKRSLIILVPLAVLAIAYALTRPSTPSVPAVTSWAGSSSEARRAGTTLAAPIVERSPEAPVARSSGVAPTIRDEGTNSPPATISTIRTVTGLRVEGREEGIGLDVREHGEEAYTNGEGAILVLPDRGIAASDLTPSVIEAPAEGNA